MLKLSDSLHLSKSEQEVSNLKMLKSLSNKLKILINMINQYSLNILKTPYKVKLLFFLLFTKFHIKNKLNIFLNLIVPVQKALLDYIHGRHIKINN